MTDPSIEQLREVLARQILELAIKADNEQYKLDAYKATEVRGRTGKAAADPVATPMANFHARVKAAEMNGDNGEPPETDS